MALVGLPVIEALLNRIISVGVLRELNRMSDDLAHQLLSIICFESLSDEKLDDAEAMIIHR